MSKGADSAILSRCIPRKCLQQKLGIRSVKDQGISDLSSDVLDQEEKTILQRIEEFASQGFRTLTFALKELESAEIDGVFTQEDIEGCLSLQGASCVEDLLQHDVARCLVDFQRAGIQTWMLTGDKGKTAKMIGIQCGLFTAKPSKQESLTSRNFNLNGEQVDTEEVNQMVRYTTSKYIGENEIIINSVNKNNQSQNSS